MSKIKEIKKEKKIKKTKKTVKKPKLDFNDRIVFPKLIEVITEYNKYGPKFVGLVHLRSFNHAISENGTLNSIIKTPDPKRQTTFNTRESRNPDSSVDYYTHKITYNKFEYVNPMTTSGKTKHPIYPSECIRTKISYIGTMNIHYTYQIFKISKKDSKLTEILNMASIAKFVDLPVMVGSNICNTHGLSFSELRKLGEDPEDVPGYYIINGNKKAIKGQESMCGNEVRVFPDKKKMTENKFNNKTVSAYIAEVRARPATDFSVIYKPLPNS